MRQTENLGLALYDSNDKMNVTGESDSLNHNMELLDAAVIDKVSKEEGKRLSTYDYDQTSKDKVDAIPENPKYTDTVYDDTEIREKLSGIESRLGLPSSFKNAILECFSRVAWIDADGVKAYQKLEAAMDSMGEASGGGGSGSETGTMYKIIYNLKNCTADNQTTIIKEGNNLVTNIIPDDGYELFSCTATMVDVTTSFDDGIVIINNVTSDITINVECSVVDVEIPIDEFISGKIGGYKNNSTVLSIDRSSRTSRVGLDIIAKASHTYMVTINLVDTEQSVSPIQYGVQLFAKETYDAAEDGDYLGSTKDSGWKTNLTYTVTYSVDGYVMYTFNADLDTTKSNIKSVRIERVV